MEAPLIAHAVRYDIVYLTISAPKDRITPHEIVIEITIVIGIDRRCQDEVRFLDNPIKGSDRASGLYIPVCLCESERVCVIHPRPVPGIWKKNVDLLKIDESTRSDAAVRSGIEAMNPKSLGIVDRVDTILVVASWISVDIYLLPIRIRDRKVI